MGNQVGQMISEHSVGDQVASGGPGCIWRIYDATKRSNDERVSLFVFDKGDIEKEPQSVKDGVLRHLKHDAMYLTKLRHPHVLRITSSLQENKKAIMMETEPVFASLANILKDWRNLSPPHALEKYELHPLELKQALMTLAEALQFLHHTANVIHRNLEPTSIYLTKEGKWKLGGFNFAAHANYKPGSGQTMQVSEFNCKPGFQLNPSLDYVAPEFIFVKCYDYISDLFSLGCVIYEACSKTPFQRCENNVLTYKQKMENIARTNFAKIPDELKRTLQGLLTVDPRRRVGVNDFLKSPYFNDINIRALAFLASLIEKDNATKAAFFKGFVNLVPNFPRRLLMQKVCGILGGACPFFLSSSRLLPTVSPFMSTWKNTRPVVEGRRVFFHVILLFIVFACAL
eukprot:TRINITY_DN2427_c0_g1_i3.p1 TRINITY_DN2427_c0_g1~~TRINITY_DN2427_c0_g1_i3.p1  ORF type:complete len:416 (+),score=107.04 TRINITY_DN2427_c0_g1_i3:49-1248(+)